MPVVELRVDLAGDRVGHLLDGDGDEDARARAVRELLLARLREEAVHQQVPLRRRVELERPLDAVVVRGDQALGRDERGGAAAERDDRAHGLAGQVGEGRRVALEAHGLQLLGQVGDLLRHPHPLVGGEGQRGDDERGSEGEGGCGRSSWSLQGWAARAANPPRIQGGPGFGEWCERTRFRRARDGGGRRVSIRPLSDGGATMAQAQRQRFWERVAPALRVVGAILLAVGHDPPLRRPRHLRRARVRGPGRPEPRRPAGGRLRGRADHRRGGGPEARPHGDPAAPRGHDPDDRELRALSGRRSAARPRGPTRPCSRRAPSASPSRSPTSASSSAAPSPTTQPLPAASRRRCAAASWSSRRARRRARSRPSSGWATGSAATRSWRSARASSCSCSASSCREAAARPSSAAARRSPPSPSSSSSCRPSPARPSPSR